MNHLGEGSRANVKAKGIMKDESSAKIQSLLHIFPSGKKSNTHSSQHFLLLSKKSRADPSPALEIEIDDVLAGHAASVSQLDSEKLFYLTSKGITEEEAHRILTIAFMEPEISEIAEHAKAEVEEVIKGV